MGKRANETVLSASLFPSLRVEYSCFILPNHSITLENENQWEDVWTFQQDNSVCLRIVLSTELNMQINAEQQRRNRTCSEPYYWTPFKRHSNDVFIPIYLPRFSISSLFFHRFFSNFYFININVTHSSIQMVCLNFQSENVSIKSDKKGNKITFCMKLHANIAIG